MTHQRITFEWRIGETEFDLWTDSQTTLESSPQLSATRSASSQNREQLLVNYLLRSMALFAVAIVAAAGLSFSPRQVEWERSEAGIRTSLERENRAWYGLDREQFLATVDSNIDSQWANEWRRHWRGDPGNRFEYGVELRGIEPLGNGIVRATVAAHQPAVEWSQVAYLQEARYYRETPGGWVRTVPGPNSDYWGERRVLELENLRFIYYARDEETVQYAAPRVAEALAELYRLLDFQPTVGYEQFTIELLPDRMGRWAWDGSHLQMTSPSLSSVPDGLTHGEYLTEGLFSRLSYRIFHEAPEPGGRFLFRWTVLNWGLRRWMGSSLLDQPSPWHDHAIQVMRAESAGRLPLSLLEISDSEQVGRPERDYVVWRFLAAETVVDYATATYGEETLAGLVRAFTRYPTWNEMIPAVYGVDFATFAAGWNQYLQDHYEIE